MALTPRPDAFPDFATAPAASDETTPPPGNVTSGWLGTDKPPHDWFNWLHKRYGAWLHYVDERLFSNWARESVLRAGGVSANGGNDGVIVDTSSIILTDGTIFETPANDDTGNLGGDATYWVYWSATDGALGASTTASDAYGTFLAPAIPVARVVKSGGVVTEIVALARVLDEHNDTSLPVTVGALVPGRPRAMFSDLHEALVYLSGRPDGPRKILLVGDVTLSASIKAADIPDDGLVIESASGPKRTTVSGGQVAPMLKWSFDGPAFDLDTGIVRGLTFRNVVFDKTVGVASVDDVAVRISGASVVGLRFEGCSTASVASPALVGLVRCTSGGVTDLELLDCGTIETNDFVVDMPNGGTFAIDRLRVRGGHYKQVGAVVGTDIDAFDLVVGALGSATDVWFEGPKIEGYDGSGIRCDVTRFNARGCHIISIGSVGAVRYGIDWQPAFTGSAAAVEGNVLGDITGDANTAAIRVGANAAVKGNAINGFTTLDRGIEVTGDDTAVTGNKVTGTDVDGIYHNADDGSITGNTVIPSAGNSVNGAGGANNRRACVGNALGGVAPVGFAGAGDVVASNS